MPSACFSTIILKSECKKRCAIKAGSIEKADAKNITVIQEPGIFRFRIIQVHSTAGKNAVSITDTIFIGTIMRRRYLPFKPYTKAMCFILNPRLTPPQISYQKGTAVSSEFFFIVGRKPHQAKTEFPAWMECTRDQGISMKEKS